MFGMGHWEILIIFLVILLIFGAKRIPEMAQGLGKGIREFRTAMRDVQDEIDVNAPNPPAQQPQQPQQNIETAPPAQSVAQNAPQSAQPAQPQPTAEENQNNTEKQA